MPPTTGSCPFGESPSISVLIVDDFRDSADSLADLLRICGHGVQTAYDGGTALAAERPDVVILELRLPGMDGWELVRQLRDRFADHQPVYVAVTTCGLVQERRQSEETGIDFHLLKPVEPGVLMDLLKRLAEASAEVG
ncbi:response regulator [Gemmata sp. G18]|uniref:Response regulator n=1 Tax=Gemmata palustris TaxID=2822762 RepID=A0ABS5BQA9_9BACT|nr:response regulator [Gemmata palustris]MBP3955632.1 response regulator [Gemmata palustris]